MSEYEVTYLVNVSQTGNHNKFYRMIPQGDRFSVEFGRVGASCQTSSYPISQWNKKKNEKLKKGYVDQTELMRGLTTKIEQPQNEYLPIEITSVAELTELLQSYARQKVRENYLVKTTAVTQDMVDEAQRILGELVNETDTESFNQKLLSLFSVIPRRMSNVASYTARDCAGFANIIQREQDLLDAMRGQVVQNSVEVISDPNVKHNCTVLDALGISVEPVDELAEIYLKSMLGSCADRYVRAWRVTNHATQKRFDEFVKENNITKTMDLFHGSRNENWWNILQTGLMLRPTNVVFTGSLYGHGIYFAPKAQKSLGYTSVRGSYWAHGSDNCGFMAVMDTAYGTPFDVYDSGSQYYSLDYEGLQKLSPGATCLHAHAGASLGHTSTLKNDEIIYYKEAQMTIKYLIQLH